MTQTTRPRHLGLPRRQSYDRLSTAKSLSQSLSLGTLPSPQFCHLPSGQRSVPAFETNRRLGVGFRSVSGDKDVPRTPGGSLVVGSEVFGFGKAGKERWGSGEVDRDDEEGDENTPKVDGAAQGSDWPGEFANAVSGGQQEFQLHGRGQGSESGSSDFNLPRPPLKSFVSSTELRSSSLLNHVNSDDLSNTSSSTPRPSSARPTVTRSISSTPLEIPAAEPAGLGFAPPGTTGDMMAVQNGYAYGGDASSAYYGAPALAQGRNARGPQAPIYGGFEPPFGGMSPDDLAFGMGNMNLSNGYRGAQGGQQRPTPQQPGVAGRPAYGSYPPRDPISRQGSYPPYYLQQPFGLSPQDAYGAYVDPSAYFQPIPDDLSLRRDSGYAPSPTPAYVDARTSPHLSRSVSQQSQSWNPMDFPQQSNPSSRQGSFSYSPALSQASITPYGLAPGAAFGGNSLEVGNAFVGQQQQILLGRGMRSAVEYIAPGPPTQYGYGRYEDVGRVMRSQILEEFRTNRHRSWELMDLIGHITEFSGDQLGSRHIQTKLETASSDEKQLVFDEILPNMLQLSTDVFANYVIQKFFEQGSQAQKTAMAKVLEGHVLQLSLQMYGCRVVQKALEYVLVDQQVRLAKELDGHVLKCARDAQSNHVVQRALERIPSEHLLFITDACIGQVHALATHPYGCRVLQRIFENCPSSQTRTLLDELHRYTQNLIQDQYGNYVVQWVIEKGERADKSLVIGKVYGQVLPLAQQKFASNVIEKCIVNADQEERHKLIDEVLRPAPDGSSVIKAMLVHPYANYVMQKILHTALGEQRQVLFEETSIQLANLKKFSSSYSKHLIAIEKLLVSERARTAY